MTQLNNIETEENRLSQKNDVPSEKQNNPVTEDNTKKHSVSEKLSNATEIKHETEVISSDLQNGEITKPINDEEADATDNTEGLLSTQKHVRKKKKRKGSDNTSEENYQTDTHIIVDFSDDSESSSKQEDSAAKNDNRTADSGFTDVRLDQLQNTEKHFNQDLTGTENRISSFAKSVSESKAEESQILENMESEETNKQIAQIKHTETDSNCMEKEENVKQRLIAIWAAAKVKLHFLWSVLKKFVENNRRSSVILFFTLIPALVTFLYAVLFYDPMYISKTSFTINSNTTEKAFDFGVTSLFAAGINKDPHIVYAYIKSLDLFNDIDKEIHLKEHYQNHDLVSTMPSNPTMTDIEEYWAGVTTVKIDADSDIILMTVRSYDPEYSKLLADTILKKIDNLVNTMNANALEDSIKLAKREVNEAENRVKNIADKIRVYRDEHEYIDPKTEAGSTLGIVSNLENEIAKKKAELTEKLGYMHSNSQEILILERKIASLEEQVKELRSKIVSNGKQIDQKSMSKSVAEYEKLELEYQFAQKILESSRTSLEVTRQQSLSKNKYLVKIDEPKIPDESLWPRPFKAACIVMAISFLLILGVSLIISAIMEHLGI